MTKDAIPEVGRAPTFDEVMKFAVDAGLYGKVSVSKFYDYYNRDNFMYRGYVMDWKTKLREWAQRQKGTVVPTAQERRVYEKSKPRMINVNGRQPMNERDYFDYLDDLLARNAI